MEYGHGTINWYSITEWRWMNNVYNHPEYRNVVQELKERLKQLKEEAGDPDEKYPQVKEISGL